MPSRRRGSAILSPKCSPQLSSSFHNSSTGYEKPAKRSIDEVCNTIGLILDTVTSAECENSFANTGYEIT